MIEADLSEIYELATDLRTNPQTKGVAGVQRAVGRGALRVEGRSKLAAPVEFGNLQNSISTDIGDLNFEVGPEANYGGFVEEGTTGPYPIENAFGRGILVMHPGNSPQPYMGPSFDRELPKTLREIRDAGADGIL